MASLQMVDGLPQTTKASSVHHGYGLKNMRETAEKYGGSLTAHAEDDWFVVRDAAADAARARPAHAHDAESQPSERLRRPR